jgi:hypothetical protein
VLGAWQASIVDEAGNVIPGASVEVRDQITLVLVDIYSDRDGNTPISNPMLADGDGFAQFYVLPGRYRVRASASGFQRTWSDVIISIPEDEIILPAISVLVNNEAFTAGAQGLQATTNDRVLARVGGVLAFVQLTTGMLGDGFVTYAKIANASALSVLGRASNSSGVLADIQAGTDNQVLRRSGTALAFGAVNLASSDAVTGDLPFANIAQITGPAVLGVASAGAGDLAAISASADDRVLRRTSGALTFGQLTAGMFPNTVVPDAALSANIPLLNTHNSFLAQQTISAGANAQLNITNTSGPYTLRVGADGGGGFVLTTTNHALTLGTNGAAWLTIATTGTIAVTGPGDGGNVGAFNINSALPQWTLFETDAAADEGHWSFSANGGQLRFRSSNDANNAVNTWLLANRDGNTVDSLALSATIITLNGVAASDFARLSASNVFTTSGSGTAAALRINATPFPFVSWRESSAAANNRLWDIGVVSEQLRFRVINDAENSAPSWMTVDRTGTTVDTVALSATGLSFTGAVTTPNTSASEVGFKGIPRRTVSSSGSTVAADTGGGLSFNGASITITIDDDAHPVDTVLTFIGDGGANNGTISITGATLYLAGTAWATSGNRTLAAGGVATAYKLSGSTWIITGTGLT